MPNRGFPLSGSEWLPMLDGLPPPPSVALQTLHGNTKKQAPIKDTFKYLCFSPELSTTNQHIALNIPK